MSVQMINQNSPKMKVSTLFGSSQSSQRKTPNPLRFTTESSLEETNKLTLPKSEPEKKPKLIRTSENWFG